MQEKRKRSLLLQTTFDAPVHDGRQCFVGILFSWWLKKQLNSNLSLVLVRNFLSKIPLPGLDLLIQGFAGTGKEAAPGKSYSSPHHDSFDPDVRWCRKFFS